MVAAVLLAAACSAAPAEERVIHGFEHTRGLQASGKVTLVHGADVVTEGTSALQLAPGSSVRLTVPANVIDQVGWLRIDTFELQPVLASLQITVGGASRQGHVQPGKDTLAFPLDLAAGTERGAWPKKPLRLEIRNAGRASVVVDNVRAAPPARPPPGGVLLDFGPAHTAVWPGFEPAGPEGTDIAWSGQGRIYALSSRYPDPLLGDFAGLYPSHMTRETLTITPANGASTAWAWLTHYGSQFSPALEYMAGLNNRKMLHHRLSPMQMLSAEGLLAGKSQPWTTQWLEASLVPKIVSKVELPLKAGVNLLHLANCQVAALVMAPRAERQAMRTYVHKLEQDLKRYRRQFVLASQRPAHCDVPPTEAESRAGVMVFLPPPEEWFNRIYSPAPEHRANSLKLAAAPGTTVTAALAAVPCEGGKVLQAAMDSLRDRTKGTIPAGSLRLAALETVPAVRDGIVHYQPFLPARDFRPVRALGVYWFILQVAVPERTRPGSYQGTLRVMTGATGARLPVEVQVFGMASVPREDGGWSFGVLDDADPYSVYRSLARVLPAQRQKQITREIFTRLFAAGLNGGMVPGPIFSAVPTPAPRRMIEGLRTYPRAERARKTLVDLRTAVRQLTASSIQPATALYAKAIGNLVRLSNGLAGKAGLGDYALYISHARQPSDMSEVTRLAAAVRRAGGSPAVHANASILAAMPAGQRAQLLKALDTLICVANHKALGAIRDEFKKTGPEKNLLVSVGHTDVYACGFYSWAVGADGVFVNQIFSSRPLFNGFYFDGLSLLVPTPQGGFEPTLGLLQLGMGAEDYALAKRCEALIKPAKARRIDTQELEKVLTEIRLTAGSRVPGFSLEQWRSRSVSAKQLQDWRLGLFRAAGNISERFAR